MAPRLDREGDQSKASCGARGGTAIYDALCGSGITAKMAARGGAAWSRPMPRLLPHAGDQLDGRLPADLRRQALTLELGERALGMRFVIVRWLRGYSASIQPAIWRAFSAKIAAAGYDGVMNCPTVALIDGKFRSDLEETGMGFAREVDVLGDASRMGLFTKAFCTSPAEALAMAGGWRRQYHCAFRQQLRRQHRLEDCDGAGRSLCNAPLRCSMRLRGKYSDRVITIHGGAIETPERFRAVLETRAAHRRLRRRLVGRTISDRDIGRRRHQTPSRGPAVQAPTK